MTHGATVQKECEKAEEAVAERREATGPGAVRLRQGEPIEEGGQEDQQETGDLADGGDVQPNCGPASPRSRSK